MITKLLERALSELRKLPEAEQDAIASWLLEDLASEKRWDNLLSESQSTLQSLADAALAEHRKPLTEKLDPENL